MTARDTLRTLLSRARELLDVARYTLGVAWATCPGTVVGLAVLNLIRVALPAALVLVVRNLINAALVQIDSGGGELGPALPWLVLGFGLTALEAVASLGDRFLNLRLQDDLNFRITVDILDRARGLDLSFFEDPRMQETIERARQDSGGRFARFLVEGQLALVQTGQALTMMAVLVVLEPLVLVVAVPLVLPYLLVQGQLARRRYRTEYLRAEKRRWSRYFVGLLSSTRSVGEVRVLDLGPLLLRRFRALMDGFRKENRRLHLRDVEVSSVFSVLMTATFYLIFVRVTLRVLNGSLSVGDLAIFGGATTRLRAMLDAAIRSGTAAMEHSLYVENTRAFLSTESRIRSGSKRLGVPPRGALAIEHVTFTYPGSTAPVLRDLSLDVVPGETLAIVGENGAGKSTLVKLVARLYDPDAGRILLDGIPLPELRLDSLHAALAYLGSDFGRYEATVAENIAYGDWRRLLEDREQVERIARMADVDGIARALPDGYDTSLGRAFGYTDLSGGQWQRLALARTLARDSALLILDEPTSAMDARAESALLEKLHDLARDRTTLLVSHRFSTVAMADRIAVMHEGTVVELGTHRELLAKRGYYARLYELHERYRVEASSARD